MAKAIQREGTEAERKIAKTEVKLRDLERNIQQFKERVITARRQAERSKKT